MASAYVRTRTLAGGSKRYDVEYRRGGRYTPIEHAGTFGTLREAKIRRDLVGDLLAAALDPKTELRRRLEPEHPLREAAAGWIAARRQVKPRTRESYGWREAIVLEVFGDVEPGRILVEDVIDWIGELSETRKPGSVRALVDALRMMLDHVGGPNAARDRRVHLPRLERVEKDPPDAGEVLAMLQTMTVRHVAAAVAMELLGTRVSETLAIEQRDLQEGVIRLRSETTKRGASRFVEAPAFLLEALAERVPLAGSRQGVAQATHRAAGINPHALRHRRATLWYQAGVGPLELARRLGHARPSMSLDTYAHIRPLEEIAPHELEALLR